MPNKQQKEERVGIKEFIAFLEKKKAQFADRELKVMIASHNQTDSDAAASAYLLDILIKSYLKDKVSTTIVFDDVRSPDLQKILDMEATKLEFKYRPKSEVDPAYVPDLLICVDCQLDPKRVILPSHITLSGIEAVIIDHHEKSKYLDAKFTLVDESYKSNVALIFDYFMKDAPDFQFSSIFALMCMQGIKVDSSKLTLAGPKDLDAFRQAFQRIEDTELSQFMTLDDFILTETQKDTYALGIGQCRIIENFCKFSYIPGIINHDDQIATKYCADFLYNQTKPIDISNAVVATIETDQSGAKNILITVRGEECNKVASIYGGGGQKDKAAASIKIDSFFEKAVKTPFFQELIEKEIVLRIMGSYLNKSENKPEPKKALTETTQLSLEDKLKDNNLNPEDMTLIARGLEYNSARQNIRSFFVHNLATKPYGGAISEDQLSIMTNIVHQFQKFKGTDVSVVYSLVNGPSGMYVLALVASEKEVKHNAKYVATELMGEKAIDKSLSKGDDYIVTKVPLNFFQYTWGDDLLSKCVYIAFEEKLEELFNQNQHLDTNYLVWKKEHKW